MCSFNLRLYSGIFLQYYGKPTETSIKTVVARKLCYDMALNFAYLQYKYKIQQSCWKTTNKNCIKEALLNKHSFIQMTTGTDSGTTARRSICQQNQYNLQPWPAGSVAAVFCRNLTEDHHDYCPQKQKLNIHLQLHGTESWEVSVRSARQGIPWNLRNRTVNSCVPLSLSLHCPELNVTESNS
jgi:hypothetical protein